MWTYQHGLVKCRTNLAVQGLNEEELTWVKINMDNWDPPDCPLPLPEPHKYDAASLVPTRPIDGAATRETVTCPACLATRRKKRMTTPHSLAWGECLRAAPPPPLPDGPVPEVEVADLAEETEQDETQVLHPIVGEGAQASSLIEPLGEGGLDRSTSANVANCSQRVESGAGSAYSANPATVAPAAEKKPVFNTFLEHPHACLAFSEAATWGSAHHSDSTNTDVPDTEDGMPELANTDDEFECDDDWVVSGGASVPMSENHLWPNQGQDPPPERNEPISEETATPEVDQGEFDACDPGPEMHTGRRLTQRERRERKRARRQGKTHCQDVAAAATQASTGHVDLVNKDALKKLLTEESVKKLVSTKEVSSSTGTTQERWKLAAEAELTQNFQGSGAFHESTSAERAAYGRPLPMTCVWSQDGNLYKCRACVCGNFEEADPTQQSWTAQAEPSSLFASLKLGRLRGWTVSKHDVKGAFLNASLPEGKLVIVSPPQLWIRWGLVAPGTTWTLDKAVYGLRESPRWWGEERDKQLTKLRWQDPQTRKTHFLEQCTADTQLWYLREADNERVVLGVLLVYVDDFLLQAPAGSMRSSFLSALGSIWTLAKESTLCVDTPLTFLGMDIHLLVNGDLQLQQERFVDSILSKYGMADCNPIKAVQMGPVPSEPDEPTLPALRQLQAYGGEFNWLATRTRPDISYYTSLLSSSCSKYGKWSLELAQKILRFLRGTKSQGITITCSGDEQDLAAWTDAGFAGPSTHSQTGIAVVWAGTIIVWRSSRQSISALSTAEAELYAATLGWQIVEGLRHLISNFGVEIPKTRVLIDNKAALTIAMCGANWRTRYFAVRGHRLYEEHQRGAADLLHCPTQDMIADSLTKLAAAPVIQITQKAMEGVFPEDVGPKLQKKHHTSVTPGPQNRGDTAGDDPCSASSKAAIEQGETASVYLCRCAADKRNPDSCNTATEQGMTVSVNLGRCVERNSHKDNGEKTSAKDTYPSLADSILGRSMQEARNQFEESVKRIKVDQLQHAEGEGPTDVTVAASGAGSAYSGSPEDKKTEAGKYEEPGPARKKRRGKKRCRLGSSEWRWKQVEEADGPPEHPQPADGADDGGSM